MTMPMLKWLWLTLLAVLLDQGSKLAVDATMLLYESVPVMPYFNLTYVHNPGAAFSFLSEAGGWQRWFFFRTGADDQRGDHDLARQTAKA